VYQKCTRRNAPNLPNLTLCDTHVTKTQVTLIYRTVYIYIFFFLFAPPFLLGYTETFLMSDITLQRERENKQKKKTKRFSKQQKKKGLNKGRRLCVSPTSTYGFE
jgi:hypothetical protein